MLVVAGATSQDSPLTRVKTSSSSPSRPFLMRPVRVILALMLVVTFVASGNGAQAKTVSSSRSHMTRGANAVAESLPYESLRFSQISTGEATACGVTPEHSIACWGSNSNGSAQPPQGKFMQVTVQGGQQFADLGPCGVTVAGELICWGVAGGIVPNLSPGVRLRSGSDNGLCWVRRNATLLCLTLDLPFRDYQLKDPDLTGDEIRTSHGRLLFWMRGAAGPSSSLLGGGRRLCSESTEGSLPTRKLGQRVRLRREEGWHAVMLGLTCVCHRNREL